MTIGVWTVEGRKDFLQELFFREGVEYLSTMKIGRMCSAEFGVEITKNSVVSRTRRWGWFREDPKHTNELIRRLNADRRKPIPKPRPAPAGKTTLPALPCLKAVVDKPKPLPKPVAIARSGIIPAAPVAVKKTVLAPGPRPARKETLPQLSSLEAPVLEVLDRPIEPPPASQPPLPPSEVVVLAPPRPARVRRHDGSGCLFITTKQRPWLFCDADLENAGSSWCAKCANKVFDKSVSTRQRAA